MKKLLDYLPTHFVISLVAGILFQYYLSFWNELLFVFLFVFFCIGAALHRIKSKWFSIITFLFFLGLGSSVTYLSDDRNREDYYEKYLSNSNSCVLKIQNIVKSNDYYQQYEARVESIDKKKTRGVILLKVRKVEDMDSLKIDDRILIASNFTNIQPALNPYQFNYKNYLERKNIYKQLYATSDQFLQLKSEKTFLGMVVDVRVRIQRSLESEKFSKDTYGVMNALLLGQRQDISKELLDDYSQAGAIHILAVSGLHVGILLLLLSSILKPVERLRNGKIVKTILIVIALWFFAILAGLSASVVRAVTMFSIVAIGQIRNEKNNVIRSLIFSLLLLLLCKPMFLFDVGFQLSYLAVFGIVTIQPKLENIWTPKLFFLRKIWQLTTVSIAAQLIVLPLSLFYFHQFPGLFLLSNLVIVPFLGIVLVAGIVVILLSLMNSLPEFMGEFYEIIISLMNQFVSWISNQEAFLFSDISFSWMNLIAFYILIFTGVRFCIKLNVSRFMRLLTAVLLMQGVFLYEKIALKNKHQLLIFHQYRKSIYAVRSSNQIILFQDKGESISNPVRSFIREEKATPQFTDYNNYMQFKGEDFLIVDNHGIFNIDGIHNPIVFLRNAPKINLERLIHVLNPKQIIADGSNYKNQIQSWEQTCLKTKTPFWYTGQNGAYILE